MLGIVIIIILRNATSFKIVFCYLYIYICFIYIYFIISESSYCILLIFLLYTVICLYFIMNLKAMNFFDMKLYYYKYVFVHSIAFIILNNAFLCVLFHFPYWLWLFKILEKLRGHHA